MDGSDLVDVYVSAEVSGDSAVTCERAFEALVRESAALRAWLLLTVTAA